MQLSFVLYYKRLHDQRIARRQVNNRPSTKDKPFNNPLQIQLNDGTRRRVVGWYPGSIVLPSRVAKNNVRDVQFRQFFESLSLSFIPRNSFLRADMVGR